MCEAESPWPDVLLGHLVRPGLLCADSGVHDRGCAGDLRPTVHVRAADLRYLWSSPGLCHKWAGELQSQRVAESILRMQLCLVMCCTAALLLKNYLFRLQDNVCFCSGALKCSALQ